MARAPRPSLSAAVLLGQGLDAGPAETRRLSVLVADADPARRERLRDTLLAAGEAVVMVTGWVEAQGALTRTPFDAALLALDLPDAGGLGAVRALRGWPPPVSAMALLAFHDDRVRVQERDWRDAGLDALLRWPMLLQDLAAEARATVVRLTPAAPLDPAHRAALHARLGPEALAAQDRAALRAAAEAMGALRMAETPEDAVAAAEAIATACEVIGAPAAAAAARRAGQDFPRGQAELATALAAAGTAIRMAGRRR